MNRLVLPCAQDIIRLMIGADAESKFDILSLSDNTVQRHISDMSNDINIQIIEDLMFTSQLDESADVSSCAQVMVFVRYIHKND